jgi:alpha-galactosidase
MLGPGIALVVAGACGATGEKAAPASDLPSAEMREVRRWVSSKLEGDLDAQALYSTDPPFSFLFDGRPSTEFLKTWELKRAKRGLDAARTEHSLTYTDPRKRLVLRCVAVQYADSPAIEWTLHFTNTGTADTPILQDLWALDTNLPASEAGGEYRLDYADGSHEQETDFRPRQALLAPGSEVQLSPYGGRSSDGVMPFFNLTRAGRGGAIVGIGWTGQWTASFLRDKDSGVRIRAGMERTHLRLHPGETIRTPAVLLLFWTGDDRLRGHNQLRRLLLNHFTPRVDAKPLDPPIALSPHGYIAFNDTTEANMLQCVANAAANKFPIDCYWIDAGWSIGGFPGGMGNWDPDPARFPRGLRPVAEAVHRNGWRFLVWFEPERVMRNTWLHRNHPQWCLSPGKLPPQLEYHAKDGFFLLNLGNPEALRWASDKTSAMIRNMGVDIYRHDFNMYPLYYWRNNEAPDRQGMNEIRYVTGLYEFFDSLRRAHPGVLIDNCASGGRRLDFEMSRRTVALLTSDYLWKPVAQQAMTYGLSFWMPLHGFGAVSLDPYDFRSGMGSSFALAIDYQDPKSANWAPAKRLLDEQRRIRHLYSGDFYPLTPYSVDAKTWIAWQFDRPDLGEGLIQAFRRKDSPCEATQFKLRGLEPGAASYRITNLDVAGTTEATGRQLMEEGLTVRILGRPGGAVITYKRTN